MRKRALDSKTARRQPDGSRAATAPCAAALDAHAERLSLFASQVPGAPIGYKRVVGAPGAPPRSGHEALSNPRTTASGAPWISAWPKEVRAAMAALLRACTTPGQAEIHGAPGQIQMRSGISQLRWRSGACVGRMHAADKRRERGRRSTAMAELGVGVMTARSSG